MNETVDALKAQGIIEPKAEKSLTSLGTYLHIKASIDERKIVILKKIGAIIAKLPVDVEISKMLIYACVLDQLDVCLTVAAGISVQSPFTNRSFRDFECIQNRQHLVSDIGAFLYWQ